MTASAVYLLRHGRTAANATRTWQGQADVPLDDVGVAEAARTAAALAHVGPARIVSSDLSRALATATALGAATGVEVETDVRLREVFAGAWEGLSRSKIEEKWPAELARWKAGEDLAIGGGERISEAGARFAGALREHAAATNGVLVLVGHGGATSSAVRSLVGLDLPRSPLGRLRNAHWAVLVPAGDAGSGSGSGWTLDTWNAGPTGG